MDIKIDVTKSAKSPILEKLTYILLGVFATALIFAFFMNYLGKAGMWLALVGTIGLIFCGFYYVEKGTKLRLITWGILGTLVILGTLLIFALNLVSSSLEGF